MPMNQTEQAVEALASDLLARVSATAASWSGWNRSMPPAGRALTMQKFSVDLEAASAACALLADRLRATAEMLLDGE